MDSLATSCVHDSRYHRELTRAFKCFHLFVLTVAAVDHFSFMCFSYLTFTAFSKVTRINNSDYEVKLVDTAGQDEYSIFPAQYSMDFHGYVLVYSITSQKSFEVIKIIYEKLIDVMGKA